MKKIIAFFVGITIITTVFLDTGCSFNSSDTSSEVITESSGSYTSEVSPSNYRKRYVKDSEVVDRQ